MQFTFDENIIRNMVQETIDEGLIRVGILLTGEAKSRVPIDSSALHDAIGFEVEDSICYVIANKEYAAIQEFGGEITPQHAKALAVPIHSSAKGKSPRDFSDLVMIKRNGKPPLLVRVIKTKGGKEKRFDIMYALVSCVHITAQPYLTPALMGNLDKIVEVFVGRAA